MNKNQQIPIKLLVKSIEIIVKTKISDDTKLKFIDQIIKSTNNTQNFVAVLLSISDSLNIQGNDEKQSDDLSTRQKEENKSAQIQIEKLRETLKQLGQF